MSFVFFLVIIVFLAYCSIRRPGIAIAYVFFFPLLNNIMFEQVGLESLTYGSFAVLIPILYYKIHSKKRSKIFKIILATNAISRVYFILLTYIVLYTITVGSDYEFGYLQRFIFPGTILFILAHYFFNDDGVFKDIVLGVIIFSITTLLFLYLFKNFTSISEIERLEISESIGMGPIAQGRMAGMLCLTVIIWMFKVDKRIHRAILLLIFLLSFTWLGLTGTRGAFLALFLTIFFYIFFNANAFKTISRLVVLSVVLIPILIYSGALELTTFERLLELRDQDGLESIERYNRWIIFLNLPIENYVLGLGPGGWGKYINNEPYSFPHNIVLESIIEHGIVGVVFIFTALFNGIKITLKILRNNSSNTFIIIMALWWVYYSLNTMVSGSFIRGNMTFFTLTAVLTCVCYSLKYQRYKS